MSFRPRISDLCFAVLHASLALATLTCSLTSFARRKSPGRWVFGNGGNPATDATCESQHLDFDVDTTSLTALANRVGCYTAAKWLALPTAGTLPELTRSLARSPNVYQALRTKLWNEQAIRKRCEELALNPTTSPIDGLKRLYQMREGQG